MLNSSATTPVTVLKFPVVLEKSACHPTAVFRNRSVLLMSAFSPRKVLLLPVSHPCWQTARACATSAKQAKARTSGMCRNASRTGDRFVECFNREVVVFICAEDRKNLALVSSMLLEVLAITALAKKPCVKIARSQNRFKLCAFASRAPASGLQGNGLREMLYILAPFALPPHRILLL